MKALFNKFFAVKDKNGVNANDNSYMKKSEIDYGYTIKRVKPSRESRFVKDGNYYKNKNIKSLGSAEIICAGDLMCEPAMSEASYFDGEYDFRTCFKYIAPVLKKADLVLGNLETMVTELVPYAHEIHRVKHHFRDRYHCNAPVSYLDALKFAGFDGFVMANNHSIDGGYDGLIDTIDNVDKNGFMRTGVFKNKDEARILLVEVNGIKIGVLSYTEHINRDLDKDILTRCGYETMMNRFDVEKLRKDVKQARLEGAEFILCYIHFNGKEYSHDVIQSQRNTAQAIADAGVDCIMGSHTHSIQPYDAIISKDGRRVPVIYSLGNFITSDNTSMITRKSVLYKLVLKKSGQGVVIERESYVPCRVVEDTLRSGFKVFPTQQKYRGNRNSQLLDQAQEEISEVIGTIPIDDEFNFTKTLTLTAESFKSSNGLTVKDICDIANIDIKSIGNILLNKRTNYFTARYTWVRSNCVYFSRYLGTVEEQEARLAYKRGASVLFCSKQFKTEDGKDLPCIVVPDPAQRFYALSRYLRLLYNIPTIGVTGSVGKTTTKEMVWSVLNAKYETLKNNGNANTYAAIADTILKLTTKHQVYIQEICAFSPGWVEGGSYMLAPNMCIITNIGYPHVDLYGSIENILHDKTSLIRALPKDGVAFLNYDDERLRAYKTDKKVISFAIKNSEADYIAENINYGDGLIEFTISCAEGKFPTIIHMVGEHNVLNALAAFAVGRKMDIPVNVILKALADYRSEGMRQNVLDIGGHNIYMDCYNSAPNSVLTSVHALALMKPLKGGKKIAVIGDIPRLGNKSEEVHRDVGTKLVGENIDIYLLFGKYARCTYEVLKQAGLNVLHTESREQLNSWIKEFVKRGDYVLFKAGHPMALAKTVDQVYGTSFHITDGDVLLDNSKSIRSEDYTAQWIDGVIELRRANKFETNRRIPANINETSVVRIGKEMFSGSHMESLIIPETIKNVGYAAFYKCQSLEKVSFANGLQILERSAFNGCISLTKVKLPETLIDIGKRAFANCTQLSFVYIPSSVGHIEEDAFDGCNNLKIYCADNSYAKEYAIRKGIKFEVVNNQ